MEIIAYHESGHAVMAMLLGGRLESISIEPDRREHPNREGDVCVSWNLRELSSQQLCEFGILVALAGPAAEMIYTGERFHPAFFAQWSHDWSTAWDLAEHFVSAVPHRLKLLESMTAKVHRLFSQDDHWQAIAALADELLAHETLEAEQIEDALRPWLSIDEE